MADVGGRTTAVFNDDLAAERIGEFLRDQPRDDITGAARRKGRDHAHGFARIRLRAGGQGGNAKDEGDSELQLA